MSNFVDKLKEVGQTLLPVVAIVLILNFTLVDVDREIIIRFIVGAILLWIGLAIFLYGVEASMIPIGQHMSKEIATSKSIYAILFLSFILGFLITVAEPDLLILGNQIQDASGGSLNSTIIVWIVSFGVGIMISLGVYNMFKNRPLNKFMAIVYSIILILSFLVSEEFLAISFDASGATTGALTTPFILAISLGLAKVKGGKSSEENAFGLVGVMSSGPILAILLLSILTGQRNIQGKVEEYVFASGIIAPMLNSIKHSFVESITAVLPIGTLFAIYNFKKFKLKKDELITIGIGFIFLIVGLSLFLTGVNSGFMDMGRVIGMQLASINKWLLVGIAFIIGLIVVLVEPAVHVLGQQIEEVTSGAIPDKVIRTTLSIGVGVAIALSMVRIVIPEVKLWYFLLPGFLTAIILSFKVNPIFVGIAYDAGGVASGPMAATFVLAFAQGAASQIPTANVLVDGFGVIAMVAMTPVLSIMILGMLFKMREVVEAPDSMMLEVSDMLVNEHFSDYDTVLVLIDRGYSEQVIELAREHGASGATILNGRSIDNLHRVRIPLLNMDIATEREVIMFVTKNDISEQVADVLVRHDELAEQGDMAVFVAPSNIVEETFGVFQR